jgi:hypothetical protein
MADTSNLSELPSNPATNQVIMETKEIGSVPPTMVPQVNTNIAPPAINQQSAIQQLENDVMQAANNGLTSLPNRDIPNQNVHLTTDAQVQPNYIPKSVHFNDYVQSYESEQELLAKHLAKENRKDSLEVVYQELQIPILVGFLFFILQLPFFKQLMSRNFPSLILKDGNFNLNGYVVSSIIFTFGFYGIHKLFN